MDAKGLLQFELNGSFRVLTEPCALHGRTHYGDVTNQLSALRAAERA